MNKKQWLAAGISIALLGNVTAMAAVTADEVNVKVEALTGRVEAVEESKADKSAVEEVNGKVHDVTMSMNSLDGKVTQMGGKVTQMEGEMSQKATQASVDQLTHQLADKAGKDELLRKADAADLERLDSRVTTLSDSLNTKAAKNALDALEKRVTEDKATLDTVKSRMGDFEGGMTALDAKVDTKADKTEVQALRDKIQQGSGSVAALKDRVDTHGMAIKDLKKNKADKAETEAALGELKEGLSKEVKDRKQNEKKLNADIRANAATIEGNTKAILEQKAANAKQDEAIAANTKAVATNVAGIAANKAAIQTNAQGIERLSAKLKSEVGRLDSRIDRVGALSGALAGLKPIQYDPAAPTQVMAAVSTYEGKQGFALGVAHYAQENLMFHAGVAYDGEDTYMGNLGVTIKVGAGSKGMDRYAVQRENSELRAQLDAQERRIAELERMMMVR